MGLVEGALKSSRRLAREMAAAARLLSQESTILRVLRSPPSCKKPLARSTISMQPELSVVAALSQGITLLETYMSISSKRAGLKPGQRERVLAVSRRLEAAIRAISTKSKNREAVSGCVMMYQRLSREAVDMADGAHDEQVVDAVVFTLEKVIATLESDLPQCRKPLDDMLPLLSWMAWERMLGLHLPLLLL
jgi:hypothetical protein